jgi:hypothetical protein
MKSEGSAGDIDLAGDTAAGPAGFRAVRNAARILYFPNELVSEDPAKRVIPAQNFDVSIADSREMHAHECPAFAQLR